MISFDRVVDLYAQQAARGRVHGHTGPIMLQIMSVSALQPLIDVRKQLPN